MKAEYNLVKLKARKNPYASKLKKPITASYKSVGRKRSDQQKPSARLAPDDS